MAKIGKLMNGTGKLVRNTQINAKGKSYKSERFFFFNEAFNNKLVKILVGNRWHAQSGWLRILVEVLFSRVGGIKGRKQSLVQHSASSSNREPSSTWPKEWWEGGTT